MDNIIAQGIVGVAGCVAVIFATKYTHNPNCLWGLLLVAIMVDAIG